MINVIGIDPAPGKKSTLFDGKSFLEKDFEELQAYLLEQKEKDEKVLICWDAPLSFNCASKSPFTKRPIEKFFSQEKYYKTPKGISVLGYSGCPHWTISQYLLGYPKISNFDNGFNPPFDLVFKKSLVKHSITEVHPAVAIWIWCRKNNSRKEWEYKKNKNVLKSITKSLEALGVISTEIATEILSKTKGQDDYLDAYIAWKLGRMWIDEDKTVNILGNKEQGSFLLPHSKAIEKRFNDYQE